MDLYSPFKYKLLRSAEIVEIGEQKLNELKKQRKELKEIFKSGTPRR